MHRMKAYEMHRALSNTSAVARGAIADTRCARRLHAREEAMPELSGGSTNAARAMSQAHSTGCASIDGAHCDGRRRASMRDGVHGVTGGTAKERSDGECVASRAPSATPGQNTNWGRARKRMLES